MEKLIHNLDELQQCVDEFKSSLAEKQLILLSGPMGAGKTQFVKFLLGKDADVMSPTFAIHNRYDIDNKAVNHIDLYRLENEADLDSTGFWDVFNEDSGWIIIEWSDRLEASVYPLNWPKKHVQIDFVTGQPSARKILLS